MRPVAVVVIALLAGGCFGSGGGGGGGRRPTAGTDQTISGPTTTLAGAADGERIAWSQADGPAPARIIAPDALDSRVDFPLVGVYRLRLTVWRRGVAASDEVVITVAAPALSLAGVVDDDGNADAATVALQWRDGGAIMTTATAGDGSFAFPGLAGEPGDYRIVVQGAVR
jgi:hypothetical protein